MSWAIERDEQGQPIRMWWMGVPKKAEKRAKPVPGCPGCGLHFGWHKQGCEHRRGHQL